MAAQKLPHIVPIHNRTRSPGRPRTPNGFRKNREEKDDLIRELADTAVGAALLLDVGSEKYDLDTFQSLAFALTRALRAAADNVSIYVLDSPGALASHLSSRSHLTHALKRALYKLKSDS